jgi:hypothetical protein
MATENWEQIPDVAPLPVSQIDPASFTEEEVGYAYFLHHLSTVANAVVMNGTHRGFIDIKVWRRPQDNEPYNARILENHASLAFFYTEDRPWNVYWGDVALKARLEAVMDFWCRIQHTDGRFSEYAPEQWSLAPTGFGIKFMGETLRRLHTSEVNGGPTVDADILARAVVATQKAIEVLLTHPDLLRHATNFSNQYTGFWGGMMSFLSAYPNEMIYRSFVEMIKTFRDKLTSPVGYHYERTGCDWRYTMQTHRSNLQHVWHYVRGTELEPDIVAMERPWIDWLAQNAVLEPDGSYFTLNRAIETRTPLPGFENWETPMAEQVPLARAFSQSLETYRESLVSNRENLIQTWPSVAPLEMYSPHIFESGRNALHWICEKSERDLARKQLPYLAKDRYTHLRMDNRIAVHYTFIRRPLYYAIFNAGDVICDRQRYGLGLLWHPEMGSVLQTQSQNDGPWGTVSAEGMHYEASSLQTEITANGTSFSPIPGQHDLLDGEIVFEYALGEVGKKRVQFGDEDIVVTVDHVGAFVEHLPMLIKADDVLRVEGQKIHLQRLGKTMEIVFDGQVKVDVLDTEVAHGPFELKRVEVYAQDQVQYRIAFE